LHKFFHDQITCYDNCSSLVWTDNPWDTDQLGFVVKASHPLSVNATSDCQGNGVFCSDGGRSTGTVNGVDEDKVLQHVGERSVSYICRDYAGLESSTAANDHKIYIVDTTPPKIALSHVCHDVKYGKFSAHDGVSKFGEKYHATDETGVYTRTIGGDELDFRAGTANITSDQNTTDTHYREHNDQLDNMDWDANAPSCTQWNSNINEQAGHEMYVSAGYSKELPFLTQLFVRPTVGTEDFELNHDQHINGGFSCRDSCDTFANLNTSVRWDLSENQVPVACTDKVPGIANDVVADMSAIEACFLIPGTYTIKYTCTDKSENEADTQKRTIFIEDHKIPIITVLGSSEMSLEATNEGNYVDDGATCSDQVDGMISQNVEVSGAVVNLTREGMYIITYSCADSAGYEAQRQTRTVHVTDCNCPSCYMTGDNTITREASFPYVDEAGWCTDDLDVGTVDILHSQLTTVNQTVNVERTGIYMVTYFAQDTAGNWNYQAKDACDGREGSRCDGFDDDIRTVHIVDTLKPVIALNYGNEFFQYGDAADTGIAEDHGTNNINTQAGNVNNPVDRDHPHRVSYMAEESQSSVSGWMIGAIASAVTGLALLGYSRNTVATTVPV